MHYVYVLRSEKDGMLYTGSTNNLTERLKRHNSGWVKITKFRRPFRLIYYEGCVDRKDSMRREIYLKTSWGKKYIKNRIKEFLIDKKVPVR